MELCVHCKKEETQLYENSAPICLKCAERKGFAEHPAGSVKGRLAQKLEDAKLLADSARTDFTLASTDIPSALPHPDGVQRIHNASRKLTAARDEMMKAHKRLSDFLEGGIVPEDLERTV